MQTIKDRLENLLGVEPLIALSLLGLVLFGVFRVLLRDLSASRQQMLKDLFREGLGTYFVFLIFWTGSWLIQEEFQGLSSFYVYPAMAAVIFGAMVAIRLTKILVFEFLFFKSRAVGVPVLLVNLVTLVFSIFIAAWISTSIFGVRWAPLLATSALVSVVLGLALQDTLGNLFAGVALQFDKPYEIGDWIEVHGPGGEVFVGEVHEITWRATILYGVYDEILTLPNRLVAQSDVSNFSARKRPIFRGLSIWVDPASDPETVKKILRQVLRATPGVIQELEPLIMLRDITEKGALYRLFYPIVHYSRQYLIVDEILMRAVAGFREAGIETSRLRLDPKDTRHSESPTPPRPSET
jgi:small-conductance mechanosensitive channel